MSDGGRGRTAQPGNRAGAVGTTAAELGLSSGDRYRTRDLWTKQEAVSDGTLTTQVPPHGAAVYRMWRPCGHVTLRR